MSGPVYTVHLMLTLEVEAPDEELARISARSQVNNSFFAKQLPDLASAKVVDSYLGGEDNMLAIKVQRGQSHDC